MVNINNKLYLEDLEQAASYIKCKPDVSILITGAAGLIGSFLVDTFIHYNRNNECKIKIHAIGRRLNKLQERFAYATATDCLYLKSHDVCNPLDDSVTYDYIIHAASNADPRTYSLYPVETITANIIGTTNILEYARQNTGTRVLFTSTMEVYGGKINSDSHDEDMYGLMDFNSIRSGYPESKRVSELLCRSYVKEYGVETIITRLGYIYGPSMTSEDNKVVAQFINKALEKKDIVLKSKGEQKRSYCYVSDSVSGILCALFNGRNGEAYNVSNKDSIVTIAQMAEITAKIVGKKVIYDLPDEIEKAGFSKEQDAVLNENKLRELGFRPWYTMVEGLKRTLTILGDMNK